MWAFILDNKALFRNKTYDPNTSLKDFLISSKDLPLKMAPICMKLWTEYYCRYNPEVVLPENQVKLIFLEIILFFQKCFIFLNKLKNFRLKIFL